MAALDQALAHHRVRLPPVVVTEMLSAPKVPAPLARLLLALPILAITDGYWERAGGLRRRVLARGLRAPLAGILIGQSCLDHDMALISRDGAFEHFSSHDGLKLG